MKAKAARAYLDGFAKVASVLELDGLRVREITPWKRGYNAAIRSAFGR